jgi:serine/threonine protein kinase
LVWRKQNRPQKAVSGDAETMERTLTQEGAVAGALPYMAPEQLQGKPVDARADIFAFGCVFYEMLLPGTEDAEYPFWSADSGWLGFFAEGKVKKVRANGGPVRLVAEDVPDRLISAAFTWVH